MYTNPNGTVDIPVILVKKVYWNGSLQGYKPMNGHATEILNLLGRGRSKFTEQNIRDLENLQYLKVKLTQEGLYE